MRRPTRPEEWRKQIVIRLSSSKRFPPEARGQAGTAKVGFVLDRHGRLVSHWLEESTGNRALDVESLAIVERAQPFPIPPPDLEETHLTIAHRSISASAWLIRDSPVIGESGIQAKLKWHKVRSICRGC